MHFAAAILSAQLLVACADDVDLEGDEDPEAFATDLKGDRATGLVTFYRVVADERRCMYPTCGGYWVSRVGRDTTRCLDGTTQSACYVADLSFAKVGLAPTEETALRDDLPSVILRGSFESGLTLNAQPLARLAVSEAYRPSGKGTPSGMTYQLRDLGVRCFRAPCFSIGEYKLNSTLSRTLSSVSGALGPDAAAALLPDGPILVTGENHTLDDGGREIEISEYFTLVRPAAAAAE